MVNINFVPDDYIQNTKSGRINLIYMILFSAVLLGLFGSFGAIKIRQKALSAKEKMVNAKMAQAQESINQFEELRAKRKAMMQTALTTAELLEPVPRSVVLALLTNNMPAGMSLVRLNVVQKQPAGSAQRVTTSKYASAQAKMAGASEPKVSPEKQLEMHIDIEGIAPSDLQVAAYIKSLGDSSLLSNVALVESRESKIDDTIYRQFKLKAMLRKGAKMTSDGIQEIVYNKYNISKL